MSNGYSFTGIPDGLGAVGIKNGTVDIFVNHEYDIEENQRIHNVSFQSLNQEREEILCESCYAEWLQGIKG